jgi:hypothetical protein
VVKIGSTVAAVALLKIEIFSIVCPPSFGYHKCGIPRYDDDDDDDDGLLLSL